MAFDKEKIFKQAKELIVKHKLFFIEDVVAWLPISKDTYYRFFPIDSDEYDELKQLIEENTIKVKTSIRRKLHSSGKASELIPLYKMIASIEERNRINQTNIDHTTNGKDIKPIDLSQYSYEELLKLRNGSAESGQH